MKRIMLLLSATLLTAPAFAGDLCETNLQKLEDQLSSLQPAAPLQQQVEEHRQEALKARDLGNTDGCISHSEKALQALQRTGTDSDNPGGGAGATGGAQ
jgi:hypothetical protein